MKQDGTNMGELCNDPVLKKFLRNEFDIALFRELSTRTTDEKIKQRCLEVADKLEKENNDELRRSSGDN